MGDNNEEGQKLNDAFKHASESIHNVTNLFDGMLNKLMPQSPAKPITVEVVVRKGFLGFGRKVKRVPATVYISMNNIICMDFPDKEEMKKYFAELK